MTSIESKLRALALRVSELEQKGITPGQFRNLFTHDEKKTEKLWYMKCQRIVEDNLYATEMTDKEYLEFNTALSYLVMTDDFSTAAEIHLDNTPEQTAIALYVAWGILTPERAAEILSSGRLT